MIKAEKIMERIGNIIEEEDLSKTINFIEQAINESDDLTAMDIAAAFLLDAIGTQEGNVTGSSDYDFENTGAEEGMVRLFINIGKNSV